VRGVAIMLERGGSRISGADLLIDSDVPLGAGVSSSAALEVATGYALLALSGIDIGLTLLALACQRAENEFVGARCGIMDQFIACHGDVEHALLIDCRNLEGRSVPLDPGLRLVICNTMVRHKIAAGEYNLRRQECEEGVRRLSAGLPGIRALRDVSSGELKAHAGLLDPLLHRRCRHVVTENERTLRAAAALEAGDLALVGELMRQSQASMRDDFEISCREVDLMVEINEGANGVAGARMTGGGFGGCTISLVAADAVDDFRESVAPRYKAATGLDTQIFVCRPGPGVGAIEES
jgi:galactokinase